MYLRASGQEFGGARRGAPQRIFRLGSGSLQSPNSSVDVMCQRQKYYLRDMKLASSQAIHKTRKLQNRARGLGQMPCPLPLLRGEWSREYKHTFVFHVVVHIWWFARFRDQDVGLVQHVKQRKVSFRGVVSLELQ